ncbi:MAG TPA: phosphoribosyl-AMP cyclohydrolase [Sediminispirochaeta sp.]|nr:phosphoribosyl-AMP cyclohydrolase [Sediminispirochaeta sp.]
MTYKKIAYGELLDFLDFDKGEGLLPVICQDVQSKEVLMLAYANKEAVERSIESGRAHYYSRSRRKIWMKGESSGNVQELREIRIDCDTDTLLYLVEQRGPACHTGARSCFFRTLEEFSADHRRY